MNSEVSANRWEHAPEWYSRINVAEYEKLSSLGYTPKQLAMYYRIPYAEFMYYFNMTCSPLKESYDRGILIQQAKEGLAMTDASLTENSQLAQRYDRVREKIEFRNAIDSVFNPDVDV